MLCDAFCSHAALPRVKDVHQPRESAVFSLKTNKPNSNKQYIHSLTTHTRALRYPGRRILEALTGRGSPHCSHALHLSLPLASAPSWFLHPGSLGRQWLHTKKRQHRDAQ